MSCQKHSPKITAGLRSSLMKATPARLRLLDIFMHSPKPLSAADVAGVFGKAAVNVSTVYRNLESLVSAGLLKRLGLRSRQAFYELSESFSERRHHHHLVCLSCHKVADIADCGVKTLKPGAVRGSGFASVSDHSLEFFGYCLGCASKSPR